jgi:hypothetical protein
MAAKKAKISTGSTSGNGIGLPLDLEAMCCSFLDPTDDLLTMNVVSKECRAMVEHTEAKFVRSVAFRRVPARMSTSMKRWLPRLTLLKLDILLHSDLLLFSSRLLSITNLAGQLQTLRIQMRTGLFSPRHSRFALSLPPTCTTVHLDCNIGPFPDEASTERLLRLPNLTDLSLGWLSHDDAFSAQVANLLSDVTIGRKLSRLQLSVLPGTQMEHPLWNTSAVVESCNQLEHLTIRVPPYHYMNGTAPHLSRWFQSVKTFDLAQWSGSLIRDDGSGWIQLRPFDDWSLGLFPSNRSLSKVVIDWHGPYDIVSAWLTRLAAECTELVLHMYYQAYLDSQVSAAFRNVSWPHLTTVTVQLAATADRDTVLDSSALASELRVAAPKSVLLQL